MTLWYTSRKPEFSDFPAIAALKWIHSVVEEPDFCCEFGAREAAQKLALEMNLAGCHRLFQSRSSQINLKTGKRLNLHVGFADVTELRMSLDDDWKMYDFSLPSSYFDTGITPWSGCPKIAELKRSRFQVRPWQDEGFARSCEPELVQADTRIAALHKGLSQNYSIFGIPSTISDNAGKTVADPRVPTGSISGDLRPEIFTVSQHIHHRPDMTENPNFPDPPSSSDESPGQGRPPRIPLRHLPAWVEVLWNILQDEGATELFGGGASHLLEHLLPQSSPLHKTGSKPSNSADQAI
jgi:hypothetical protein